MARRSRLGQKVRRLRRQRGLTQVDLAGSLGISPSYLNLIEHNQRPLTLQILIKVSRIFDVDLQSFSEEDEARLVASLEEVMGDSLLEAQEIDREDVEELVGSSPEIGRAVVRMYRAWRESRENVDALAERLTTDRFLHDSTHQLLTILTSIRSFAEILRDNRDLDPADRTRFLDIVAGESKRLAELVSELVEPVSGGGAMADPGSGVVADNLSEFLERHRNHFPEIEAAAEEVWRRMDGTGDDLAAGMIRLLSGDHGIGVRRGDPGDGDRQRARIDPESGDLLLPDRLTPEGVSFALAREIGLLTCRDIVAPWLADNVLSSEASRRLAERALAGYFALALLMPYEAFREMAEEVRYDIELLAHRFSAGFEQVCYRLAMLARPGDEGVPFHLLRIDIAGNVSRRFGGSGMRIPRFGGICPRWVVHAAFATPNVIASQVDRMPDGSTWFSLARTLDRPSSGFNTPRSHLAIGLGCAVEHAPKLVYADGIDLQNETAAVPVGPGCRLCEREDCGQRAFPSMVRKVTGQAPPTG